MTKPQLTEEALQVALDYIEQSEVVLGQDSTALANSFLKGLVAVARITMAEARENPQSEIAAKLQAIRASV